MILGAKKPLNGRLVDPLTGLLDSVLTFGAIFVMLFVVVLTKSIKGSAASLICNFAVGVVVPIPTLCAIFVA